MARTLEITCAHCGTVASKFTGEINRARKAGLSLYCGKVCSGLGRRKGKSQAQKIVEKAAYDAEYRVRNAASLKAKKAAYHQRTYDPVAARQYRKQRAHMHAAYCRQPEYVEWKKKYDRQHRAKEFGQFAEAYSVLIDLEKEILSRMSRYEIARANGVFGKSQQRKRQYEALCR